MSRELRDLRAQITVRTWCALEARSRQSGKEKAEIVREILDQWAAGEVVALSELQRLLESEGEEWNPDGGGRK